MIVEIKQHSDQSATSIGLDKYNRSKVPGAFEILYPAKGIDGRWITGLDENSIGINNIEDPVSKEDKKEEIRKVRENLEKLTNLNLDATNDTLWEKFKIVLRDNKTLNLTNAREKIEYYVLIANGYAAPELGVVSSPDYVNTKYYVSRKEEESKERVMSRRKKDEATAALLKLDENYDKMVLVARFLLGSKRIKQGMSASIVYELLSEFIEDKKEVRNIIKFTEAVNKTTEELNYKLVVDEAIRKGIIKSREGYFQRGNATYGKSIKEVLEHLSSVEHSNEFASLKEEVESY